MADQGHGEAEAGAVAPESEATIDARPAVVSPPVASRRRELWLVAVLALIVAGIALSPFWAPEIAPLLPWGASLPAPTPDYAALAARLEAFERRPAAPAIDVGAIESAQGALERRVDRLEAARSPERQSEAAVAPIKAGLQQLEQRLGAIEARADSREAQGAAEVQKAQQELTRLGTVAAELADRLQAVEQWLRAQSRAQPTDAMLLVTLLQIREAVERARPFAAELRAFVALAHDRPDLVAATQPLSEAAGIGVAGHHTLVKQLAEVAGQISSAAALAPDADWQDQVLARLRALITIRRIEGTPQSEPEAAVRAAEVALGRGDLGDAVAQLDRLAGANAEAAGPWLRMARRRLAVEAALTHLQELLVAGLGHTEEGRDAPRP